MATLSEGQPSSGDGEPATTKRGIFLAIAVVVLAILGYLRADKRMPSGICDSPSPSTSKVDANLDSGALYDRALTLIQYQVELLWLIFGAFLLTETVLLAGIASSLKDDPEPSLFWGSVLGLMLTLPWGSSWSQNYHYYRLRMLQAKRFR